VTTTDPPSSKRCLATAASGRPCRAWAVTGSDYCAAHRRGAAPPLRDPPSQPPYRKLATIDDLVRDMFEKLSLLCALIDQAEVGTGRYYKAMSVYCRYLGTMSSLLRAQHALGPPTDDILDTLAQAAEELGREQGWPGFLPGE
jgi:hypothetical protein